jgi:hypothetical protein
MSTALSEPTRPATCRACGAQRYPAAPYCWLCGAPQSVNAEPPILAEIVEGKPVAAAPEQNPWLVHGSIWAGVVLAVVVGYGVVRAEDGILATAYLIAVVPALGFTMFGSALARYAGRPWDPGKKFLAFLGVFGVTTAIATLVILLLILSAIVAFFQVCFGTPP